MPGSSNSHDFSQEIKLNCRLRTFVLNLEACVAINNTIWAQLGNMNLYLRNKGELTSLIIHCQIINSTYVFKKRKTKSQYLSNNSRTWWSDSLWLAMNELRFVIKLASIWVAGNQFTSTTLRAITTFQKPHCLLLHHILKARRWVSHVAEMFDFTAWHQIASSTFHGMAFDCHDHESLQSKTIIWNTLEAMCCQTVKSKMTHLLYSLKFVVSHLFMVGKWIKCTETMSQF